MHSTTDVRKAKLCISCGACCAASPQGIVRMHEQVGSGMFKPILSQPQTHWGSGPEFDVCPGKGYEILRMGQDLFPGARFSDIELGRWSSIWAGRTLNENFKSKASSGGLMTAIADHLLNGIVEGVVVSRMKYGSPGPRVETFIATKSEELVSAQGSKYCPVPALEIVRDIESFNGRVLFIGTPCQIAALRMLQKKSPTLREKIPFTMGNFCGGFRDLRETDTLIKRAGMHPKDVTSFRYRGGGQPGTMVIEDSKWQRAALPYPGYARMTGFVKHKRCRLCVDATAELADFSCGDAWIPRFLSSGQAWSLVLTRSEKATKLLQEIATQGKIALAEVTIEELKKSQSCNLASKKKRQFARQQLYKKLGIRIPQFDGSYYVSSGGILFELRVLCSHLFFSTLEQFHIYPLFAKLIGRYPKD